MTLNTEPRDLRVPDDQEEITAVDCVRCGYSLVGIPNDKPCPECGLLAERSRNDDGHLSDATPGWLRGISVGIVLILLAHVLAAVWSFLGDSVTQLFQPIYIWNGTAYVPSPPPMGVYLNPAWVYASGFALAAMSLIVGIWLLTRAQRRHADDGKLRWLLRVASLAPLVPIAFAFAPPWVMAAIGGPYPRAVIGIGTMLILTIGCAPIPALTFVLLRRLAKRVLHPNLAEHAAIVGVGLSATLIVLPMLVLAMELGERYGSTHWTSRSNASLFIMLTGSVAFFLFTLWSGLNCIRFAIAFHRAYRGSLRKWRDADRSADAI